MREVKCRSDAWSLFPDFTGHLPFPAFKDVTRGSHTSSPTLCLYGWHQQRRASTFSHKLSLSGVLVLTPQRRPGFQEKKKEKRKSLFLREHKCYYNMKYYYSSENAPLPTGRLKKTKKKKKKLKIQDILRAASSQRQTILIKSCFKLQSCRFLFFFFAAVGRRRAHTSSHGHVSSDFQLV